GARPASCPLPSPHWTAETVGPALCSFSPSSKPFLAGGVSIALQKKGTGVRPCCGDPLRRLVAKCFCLGAKSEITTAFEGLNYGVGCKGGVEVVAHSLRDTLHK